jgi:hypothetical protein
MSLVRALRLVATSVLFASLCACQGDDNTLPLPADAGVSDARADASTDASTLHGDGAPQDANVGDARDAASPDAENGVEADADDAATSGADDAATADADDAATSGADDAGGD